MPRIRIVGGVWKRRLVSFPGVPGLRPTPDAVRETLFNWLGQDLTGLACLDLFAGSGVLGFEAASRGATRVTLVERDLRVFDVLRENARMLGRGDEDKRLELVRDNALRFASRVVLRYDLLFLDPPYRQGWIEQIEPLLQTVLAPDARIYAEAEHALDRIGAWTCTRRGRSGQVFYHLLEATTEGP